jgi:hypothetical protein
MFVFSAIDFDANTFAQRIFFSMAALVAVVRTEATDATGRTEPST